MGIINGLTSLSENNSDLPQKKTFKDQKRWISNLFYQGLNKYIESEEGNQITKAQAMVEGTIDMAINPENDNYVRLAAVKFITEHLEGKAGVVAEEKNEELPRMVINISKVENVQLPKAESFADAVPKDDIIVEISDEGENE